MHAATCCPSGCWAARHVPCVPQLSRPQTSVSQRRPLNPGAHAQYGEYVTDVPYGSRMTMGTDSQCPPCWQCPGGQTEVEQSAPDQPAAQWQVKPLGMFASPMHWPCEPHGLETQGSSCVAQSAPDQPAEQRHR